MLIFNETLTDKSIQCEQMVCGTFAFLKSPRYTQLGFVAETLWPSAQLRYPVPLLNHVHPMRIDAYLRKRGFVIVILTDFLLRVLSSGCRFSSLIHCTMTFQGAPLKINEMMSNLSTFPFTSRIITGFDCRLQP